MPTPTGGRYPASMSPYNEENVRMTLTAHLDWIRIRIDDLQQIDRWEEFFMTKAQVLQLICDTEADGYTVEAWLNPTEENRECVCNVFWPSPQGSEQS